MKCLRTLLAVSSILLGSCIEDLEPLESNFEKVYGFNLSGEPYEFSRNADGTFLITGGTERTVQNFQNFAGDASDLETRDAMLPIIIKIDQQGNELVTRTFPIQNPEYQISPFKDQGPFEIDHGSIDDALELSNGEYLAVFAAFDEVAYHHGYMLLDKDFDIRKFQLIDDSEIEFRTTQYVTRGLHKIYKSPIREDEVLIVAKISFYIDPENHYPLWGTQFYSIFKLNLYGTIVEIYDYDMDPAPLRVQDITFDSGGNMVVMGFKNFNRSEVFVHRIDLHNGEILDSYSWSYESSGRQAFKILPAYDGFVIQELDFLGGGVTNYYSVFYDSGFNITDSVSYDPVEQFDFGLCGIADFIQANDGGFFSLTFECGGDIRVLRLDDLGNEIWRWESEREEDGRQIGHLMEADDGGVYILGIQAFNSSGTKITLIKLDKNGNI